MKVSFPKNTMTLLPPAPDKCQECACSHAPEEPHNLQSLYYGMKFKMEQGRDPTWADAVAHCTPPVRQAWLTELRRCGQKLPETPAANGNAMDDWWPCACVKRRKDGTLQAIKLNPPARRQCPVCKLTPLVQKK